MSEESGTPSPTGGSFGSMPDTASRRATPSSSSTVQMRAQTTPRCLSTASAHRWRISRSGSGLTTACATSMPSASTRACRSVASSASVRSSTLRSIVFTPPSFRARSAPSKGFGHPCRSLDRWPGSIPRYHRGVTKTVETKENVVVRFAGDSGDGMQLTGDRFTNATAVLGNDLATLPDFPAEIRAPAGTVHGVSAFQIHFASLDILTPGDHPNVLVAMNPAALKANLRDLERGATVIVNEDAFIDRNIEKAGFAADPLTDGTLEGYQVYRVPMTSITVRAVEELGLTRKEAERSKNMFALGLLSWMYGRPVDVTLNWLHKKFGDKQQLYDANVAAFKAGYNFGETTELFATSYVVKPAPAAPGTYRNISGATALSWGLVAASVRSGLPLFYASYPITPASELLHEISRHKNFGVRTFQAEDEIAAANMALGAAFAGHLGVTGTSGPGMDLKSETLGLAVTLELPMA